MLSTVPMTDARTALCCLTPAPRTAWHGRPSWAQCRAQRPVTPAPSCLGWQGVDVTSVSSVTPLHCAVVRLTLWEWLNASVGCDVPVGQSGDGVDAEPASSEAENRYLVRGLSGGASGEAENRYLIRGLTCGALGEAENWYLVRGLTGGASSEAENRYLIRGLVVRGLERGGELVPRPRPRGFILGRACFG